MLHFHLSAVLVAGHIRGQDDPSRFLCLLTKRDTPSTSMDAIGFCRMERQFSGLNTSQQNSGEIDSTALRQEKHHSVQTMLKRSTSIARTVQRAVSCGLLIEHEGCTKLRIETTQGLLAQGEALHLELLQFQRFQKISTCSPDQETSEHVAAYLLHHCSLSNVALLRGAAMHLSMSMMS
jgi:hypothetical protein